jgi:hypothetical protein
MGSVPYGALSYAHTPEELMLLLPGTAPLRECAATFREKIWLLTDTSLTIVSSIGQVMSLFTRCVRVV